MENSTSLSLLMGMYTGATSVEIGRKVPQIAKNRTNTRLCYAFSGCMHILSLRHQHFHVHFLVKTEVSPPLPFSFSFFLELLFICSEICSLLTSEDKVSLIEFDNIRVVSSPRALECRTRVDLEKRRTGDQLESGEEYRTREHIHKFSFTPGAWPLAWMQDKMLCPFFRADIQCVTVDCPTISLPLTTTSWNLISKQLSSSREAT